MPELRVLRSIAISDATWRVHGVIFWDNFLAERQLESRAGSDLRHTVRRRKLQQEVRGETESRYPPRRWGFVEIRSLYREGLELGTETLRAVLMISSRYLLLSMPVWAAGFKNLVAPIGHAPRLAEPNSIAPFDETSFRNKGVPANTY